MDIESLGERLYWWIIIPHEEFRTKLKPQINKNKQYKSNHTGA